MANDPNPLLEILMVNKIIHKNKNTVCIYLYGLI
jgi:hypothetical protein